MKFQKIQMMSICISLLFSLGTIKAVIVGSTTEMSLESFVEFPATDYDNAIIGFAVMEHGFSLEDETTSCTFSSVFSVKGPITLNGGTIYLERDLKLDNVTTLTSMGHIFGNGYSFQLSNGFVELGDEYQNNIFTLDTLKLVLHSDVLLNAQLCFDGNCELDGQNNTLDFRGIGGIAVGSNGRLLIKNVRMQGLSQDEIRCIDDTGEIILQDVTWQQDEVFTFSHGAMQFKNEVRMSGQGTFAYQSSQTSTLCSNSILYLINGITFSYDPIVVAEQDLFAFESHTSLVQMFSAAWHTTVTGMQFKKGRIRLINDCYFSSEKIEVGEDFVIDNGLTFGDGVTPFNDTVLEIVNAATFNLVSGSLNYKNMSSLTLVLGNVFSNIYLYAGTRLRLFESMNFDVGSLKIGNGVFIGKDIGKEIVGSILPLGTVYYVGISI